MEDKDHEISLTNSIAAYGLAIQGAVASIAMVLVLVLMDFNNGEWKSYKWQDKNDMNYVYIDVDVMWYQYGANAVLIQYQCGMEWYQYGMILW